VFNCGTQVTSTKQWWALPTIAITVGKAHSTIHPCKILCEFKSLRDRLAPGEKCGLDAVKTGSLRNGDRQYQANDRVSAALDLIEISKSQNISYAITITTFICYNFSVGADARMVGIDMLNSGKRHAASIFDLPYSSLRCL